MQYTTYYSLSQIEATDKPTWLVMYNADMSAIDAGIHAAQADATAAGTLANTADGKADANALDIVDIKADIVNLQTAVGTATGNINTINSLIGDGTSLLTGQTIIAGLNSTDESIAPVENSATVGASYAIGDKFIRGGVRYEALTAITAGTAFSALSVGTDYKIADDLSTEIQAIANELTGKEVYIDAYDTIEVTADGIKTLSALLNELATAYINHVNTLGNNDKARAIRLSGNALGPSQVCFAPYELHKGNSTVDFLFGGTAYNSIDNLVTIMTTRVNTTAGNCYSYTQDGSTVVDKGSNVPTDGQKVTLAFEVYTPISFS